jgi:hypothetical protein
MKYIFTIILNCFLFFTIFGQGIKINKKTNEAYGKIPKKYSAFTTNQNGLPGMYDLSIYAPSVINQGDYGTCVGVSTAYYMRTILASKLLNITNKAKIDKLSYSASYLYNSIKDSTDSDCEDGLEIIKALDFIKTNGLAKMTEVPYHTCQKGGYKIEIDSKSRIMDYVRIFDVLDRSEKTEQLTKKALAEGAPVILGLMTTPSLVDLHTMETLWPRLKEFLGFELSDDENYRLWKPRGSSKFNGRHEVCLVGYDDKKFGGAFKAINSWGTWWGDNGYFWIKYSDFPTVAKYCIQAYLQPEIEPNQIELAAEIKIHFDNFVDHNEVPFRLSNNNNQVLNYHLLEPQETGSNYFFEVNMEKQGYLYILSQNSTTGNTDLLFPNTDSTSAILGPKTKFLLPYPAWNIEKSIMEDTHYELVAPTGHEYWVFLFSNNEIPITKYLKQINTTNGDIYTKLNNSFNDNLMKSENIIYDNKKIGFKYLKQNLKASILPILIDFEHVQSIRAIN